MGRVTSETRALVELQGHVGLPDDAVADLDAWLRVPPFCCGIWVIAALWVESAMLLSWWLPISAVAGASRRHPLDTLANWTVRRWRRRPAISPLPAPRRSACVSGGIVIAITVACLGAGFTKTGVAIGVVLAALTIQQAATGFCVGSWCYRWARGQLPDGNGG